MAAGSPIFSAVGEALFFGVRRLGLNLRIGWAPLTLMAVWFVAVVGLAPYLLPGAVAFTPGPDAEPLQGQEFLRLYYRLTQDGVATFYVFDDWTGVSLIALLTPVMTLFWSSYATPVLRLVALGEEPGAAPFRLGVLQLRYWAASMLSGAANVVFVAAPIALFAWLLARAATGGFDIAFPNAASLHTVELIDTAPDDYALWAGLGALVGAAAYGAMRLSALLPSVAATERIDIAAALALTRGRFFRLAFTYLLFWIAICLAAIVIILGATLNFLTIGVTFNLVGTSLGVATGAGEAPAWYVLGTAIAQGAALLLYYILYVFWLIGTQMALPASIYRRLAEA